MTTGNGSNNAFVISPLDDLIYIIVGDAPTFAAIRGPETISEVTLSEGETTKTRLCVIKTGVWNGIDIVFLFSGKVKNNGGEEE